MKRATLFAVILSLSMPAFADDAERLVLDQVVRNIVRTACEIRGQRVPPVFASQTVGGGDTAVKDLAVSRYGSAAGFEIAEDFSAKNRERVALEELMSVGVGAGIRFIDLEDKSPDSAMWAAVEEASPDASSIAFLSRPAFDRLQTVALVRTDLFQNVGESWTSINRVERQPDGSWIVVGESMSSPGFVRSEWTRTIPPDDSAYLHIRD